MGPCSQSVTVPLFWFFLLTLSPCSSVGPSHGLQAFMNCSSMRPSYGLQSFRISLHLCGSFMAHSSFRACPPVVVWSPPLAAVWTSPLAWFFPGVAGKYLLHWDVSRGCRGISAGHLQHLLSLLALFLVSVGHLTPLSQSCCTTFLSCLNRFSQRYHQHC